ncbi:MAG: hypothetical protein QG592_1816, partial [Pseudomonadota bacterium]|nr:hypothetical protein [Pseudomonadota bacterium]
MESSTSFAGIAEFGIRPEIEKVEPLEWCLKTQGGEVIGVALSMFRNGGFALSARQYHALGERFEVHAIAAGLTGT